ncbi:MAG: prepilin-type N-terminal cleavage/methylation domain-containing protein [Erysipelotrichia bacterium]|nr:prepilin-type N-terminal cleavage/methylation domain-containing protein [Candidatus Riflebacteria bacterium]NCB37760.1 prepilin-type N-terminal cleavage/methylation domain-containing protein [Erysipelotrichia bacterium]
MKNFAGNSAFTLIEILIVLFLAGLVALPFTNMFLFGVQGSHDNAEHVLAYNLAREKIEEMKGLPFDLIKSDYENFREVYQDRPQFDEAYYNDTAFEKFFSDVFSNNSLNDSELKTTFTRLKLIYPKTYLKQLQAYPEDYRHFRRLAKVEEISNSAMPAKLKKVNVLVFDKDNKKIAEIATFIGQHK